MAAYHTGIRYRARLRNVDGPIPETAKPVTAIVDQASGGKTAPAVRTGTTETGVQMLCICV